MKKITFFLISLFFFQANAQCPPSSNIDSDGDGVLDCIDPCPILPNSIIGNLSFESDFIGWTIPQNQSNFSITQEAANTLDNSKALYVTAPNATQFEGHAIFSEEFTLEEGVGYSFRIPAKRIGNNDGDALRWALVDENGVYRHLNNYYDWTENWSTISINNLQIDLTNFSSNVFRLRLEFGLSQTDMVVDRIEFFETNQGFDPTYIDNNNDGTPDCIDPIPANDSVLDATEITSLDYSESDIRLDLADVNTASPIGCNTNGFTGVYYKFTASENNYVNASILPGNIGQSIANSFVIVYTAANLNATSMSDLTHLPESACAFGTQTSFSITAGQSYYIMVHRSDANALTNFTFSEVPDVPQSERDALIAFYNSTGGTNWNNNTNWNTDTNVDTWFGVFTTTVDLNGVPYEDGLPHVSGLNFFENNNLTGTLPSELGDLTKLRNLIIRDGSITGNIPEEIYSLSDMLQIQLFNLDLDGNISSNIQNLINLQVLDIRGCMFSGQIPDLTVLPILFWLNISGNNFVFSDFEDQFSNYQNFSTFEYTPQARITEDQTSLIQIGDTIELSTTLSNANNTYTWFFNGIPLENEIGPSIILDNIQSEQMGTYYCQVTNSVVSGLTLLTGNFVVGEDPTLSPDYNTLVEFYNATGGDSWFNNTNWLNPNAPLSSWLGLTVANNNVTSISLQSNNLQGNIPNSLSDLSNAESISFRNNILSGTIPDLSTMANLETLDIRNNNFSFLDFENSYVVNSAIINWLISPQNPTDDVIVIEAVIGDDYSFSMTPIAGTNVQYQWYTTSLYDDNDIEMVSGQNTNVLNLTNLQSDDIDLYTCQATSTLIPELYIRRNTIELTGPVSQAERDALIAFYNALGGDNWNDNTNWLSNEPVSTWSYVTTSGNKVVGIDIFGEGNWVGQIPTEIEGLTNLELFSIALNAGVTGPLPESIGNLSNLKRLRIQGIPITGTFPSSIGNLNNLTELRVIGTDMTGELPSELGNLTNLTDMTLFGVGVFPTLGIQNFNGAIPDSFGNLSNLAVLDLSGNSFDGQVPTSLSNLNLQRLNLRDNDLSGALPDFSGITTSNLIFNLENNIFDFSDLEPLINNGLDYASLTYSPQRTTDPEQNIESGVGANITLSVTDDDINRNAPNAAQNNQFQWFKDNVAISGANSATYEIINAQESDSGVYFCEITNPTVSDLTIRRAPINLLVDQSLSIDTNNTLELKLYPNPAQDWITIQIGQLLENGMLRIHDMNGRLIKQQATSGDVFLLNIEDLTNGLYILSIVNGESNVVKRFIKN